MAGEHVSMSSSTAAELIEGVISEGKSKYLGMVGATVGLEVDGKRMWFVPKRGVDISWLAGEVKARAKTQGKLLSVWIEKYAKHDPSMKA